MLTEELPIHRSCVDLISRIIDLGKNFPKMYKYSVYDKILGSAVALLEPLEMANRSVSDPKSRVSYLNQFLSKFNAMKTLIRICNEKKLISIKDTANLAKLTTDIGKQATAWKNH